jgi:predicted deacylase
MEPTARADVVTAQPRPAPRPAPAIAPRLDLRPPPTVGPPPIRPELTLLAAADTTLVSDVHAEAEESSPTAPQVQQIDPAVDALLARAYTADAPVLENGESAAFSILGEVVPPGTARRLTWTATETFTGTSIPTAVLVVHGREAGPVLCLTAAVHGDELNGIETVRRVVHDLDPERLSGTVIGVPIVNLQGFHRNSRYLPDRRDLNRFFPGNPTGSAASRIAYSLFNRVIMRCDALVDLHTGSFHRTNLPQLRADLSNPEVVNLTKGFGSTVILHSVGGEGTLRHAAVSAGIPAVTLEAGAPQQVEEEAVAHSARGIQTLLDTIGMYNRRSLWGNPEPAYYQSRWVRADHGGILSGKVKLGRRVTPGEVLGTVTDPISNEQADILSPFRGRVIGMALDQFVMPGYATFHIGIEADVDEASEGAQDLELDHVAADYEIDRESGD